MDAASEAPAGIAFGRFLLLPHRRELLADGRPIKLGGRAFDVLMALIEGRGAVISRDALMARMWPAGLPMLPRRALAHRLCGLRTRRDPLSRHTGRVGLIGGPGGRANAQAGHR